MAVPAVAPPLRHLPNALTIARFALIPVFVVLVLRADAGHSYAAAFVFAAAAITDQVDGFLARRWHVESEFGKYADPLADRLMIDAAVVLLWLEGRLVLDEGKESTVIKGTAPGMHREAKESLLRGKTPERAGLHLSFGDHDCTLTMRGETLAFAGLVPPRKERGAEAPAAAPPPPPRKHGKERRGAPDDAAHEAFYERMHFAREVEGLVTALYRDFLAVRLSPAWAAHVVPVLAAWVAGEDVDVFPDE